jgi:hypothetical protein
LLTASAQRAEIFRIAAVLPLTGFLA